MRHNLHDQIRKLLRRAAKEDGLEAMLAGERAQALMAKHGVHVNIQPHVRNIPGGSETRWRERLLVAVAKRHHCRIERCRDNSANIVGERDLVEQAAEAHARLFVHVMVQMEAMLPTDFNALPPSMVPAVRRLWSRSFGMAAGETACESNSAKEEPPPPQAAEAAKAMMEDDVKAVKEDADEVGDRAVAMNAVRIACARGTECVKSFAWVLKSALMLPPKRKRVYIPKRARWCEV
jgi:hypothetical protein